MNLLYIAIAILTIAVGLAVVSTSRDLVRVLIGLEVLFIGALIGIIPLYYMNPNSAVMLTLSLFTAAVSETILYIAVLFKMSREWHRTEVSLNRE